MVPKGKQDRPQPDGRAPPVVTRRIAAEAANWIARLHGPSRSPEMEREFREWVSRSPAHGYAFERCSDVWTEVASLTPADVYGAMASREMKAIISRERWWQLVRWPLWGLLALVIIGGMYAAHRWLAVDVYTTEVGGQQQVLLADGTLMSLNTDTRVRVEFGSGRRLVSLDAGEVLFEVAKDPRRPFVVHAGGSEVIAVGTVFLVRLPENLSGGSGHRDAVLAVALVEGEVTVQPASVRQAQGMASQSWLTMRPGERLRLAKARGDPGAPTVPQIDRPPMEPLVAWKHGKAVFDDVSLREAVDEMNRYTRQSIVLLGDAAKLRISGSYEIRDAEGFAQAVAVLHGLQVREHDGRLELALPQ